MAATAGTVERLPPGRHGLSRARVRESQRERLIVAATEALAARGYGRIGTTEIARRAGVSTSTFYKRFDDLWACLLAAHEAGAERLCERIEAACAGTDGEREERVRAGTDAALALLGSEPALAQLLSAEPPSRAESLWEARRRLIARLAGLLRGASSSRGDGAREARLVGAALALVSMKARAEGAERLGVLAPTLTRLLLRR